VRSIFTVIILGYFVIGVAGDSVVALIWSNAVRPRGAERIGLAIAFGVGAVALFQFWAALIAPGSLSIWLVILPTLVLLLLRRTPRSWLAWASAIHRRERYPSITFRRVDCWSLLFATVAGAAILSSLATALSTSYVGDGLAIWNMKARLAFSSGGMPLSHLTDTSRLWSHLDYPWLVPLGQTWFYLVGGQFREVLGKSLFPLFYAGLLLLVYSNLSKLQSRPVSLAFTMVLGVVPAVISSAASGYADVAVSFYWSGSVLYLLRWMHTKSRPELVCAVVLAALAAWTKNEGLVYFAFQACAIVVFSITKVTKVSSRDWARAIGASVVILGPWLILLKLYSVPHNDYAPVTLVTFLAHYDRLPIIADRILVELGKWENWGYLWYLFGAALLLLPLARSNWIPQAYAALSVIAPLMVFGLGYVFSQWEPFTNHMMYSFDRLVLQQVPMAVLFVALQLSGQPSSIGGSDQAGGTAIRRVIVLKKSDGCAVRVRL
jgi:hypothetical protein